MRRDARRRAKVKKWWEDKKIILSGSIISMTLAIIIGVAIYSNDERYTNDYNGRDNQSKIISLAPENDIEETKSASTSVGKSVEEVTNETNSSKTTETNNATTTKANNTVISSNNSSSVQSKPSTTAKNKNTTSVTAQVKKEVEFDWPIKGDILKAFSVDNLLYSSTLQEWTVHNGIDIKAEKTSVVSSAADGTVKAIKNDPRYGLTVIIEHDDGFKTVYSNLLTSEFVVEGEKISKGQTIGTVGNSANFEVADESHVHFELLKDGEYVDPMFYLN